MADETPDNDTKRKFREALERKKTQTADGVSHADAGHKQSRGAHGPVENRREFRRKSG